MPERAVATTSTISPPSADRPDLPDELLPLHEEYGAWWVISYQPMSPKVPYAARPRFAEGSQPGRSVRTDTVGMLARVLDAATPDEDGDEEDSADDEATDPLHRINPPPNPRPSDRKGR